jgi:hypothetical protein
MTKTLEGIVISTKKVPEGDTIIDIFDVNGNYNSFLLKKPKSTKKIIYCEIGTFVKIDYSDRYKIPVITNIYTLEDFIFWKQSYQDFLALNFLLEITKEFNKHAAEEKEIYQTLKTILEINKNKKFLIFIYILKLLFLGGYIDDFAGFKNLIKINKNNQINLQLKQNEIGFEISNDFGIDFNIFKIIRYTIVTKNILLISKISTDPKTESKLFEIAKHWISFIVPFDFEKYKDM